MGTCCTNNKKQKNAEKTHTINNKQQKLNQAKKLPQAPKTEEFNNKIQTSQMNYRQGRKGNNKYNLNSALIDNFLEAQPDKEEEYKVFKSILQIGQLQYKQKGNQEYPMYLNISKMSILDSPYFPSEISKSHISHVQPQKQNTDYMPSIQNETLISKYNMVENSNKTTVSTSMLNRSISPENQQIVRPFKSELKIAPSQITKSQLIQQKQQFQRRQRQSKAPYQQKRQYPLQSANIEMIVLKDQNHLVSRINQNSNKTGRFVDTSSRIADDKQSLQSYIRLINTSSNVSSAKSIPVQPSLPQIKGCTLNSKPPKCFPQGLTTVK